MHEVACDFLASQAEDALPLDVLGRLTAALEAPLYELATSNDPDDFDGQWDLGGHLALAATDGQVLGIARAGNVRIVGLADGATLLRAENTMAADLRAKGTDIGAAEVAEEIITAGVGLGHPPADLVGSVDPSVARRLLFCALGAGRHLSLD